MSFLGLIGGGGASLPKPNDKQESIPVGCVPSAAVAVSGGGVCLGVCPAGPGVHLPLPMWTEFLTHACENITLPQLRLRTVISAP